MNRKIFGLAVVAAVAGFVIGTAGSSEAKGKKKMAAPEPTPIICTWLYEPVCAVKGGRRQTFSNACWAAKDGAKVVSQGACKPAKANRQTCWPFPECPGR
jgi:hypothetical protein